MRRRNLRAAGRNFPPAADPYWARASRGLHRHLLAVRVTTWEQLFAWAETYAVSDEELRQLVAYLELVGSVITAPDGSSIALLPSVTDKTAV